MSTLTAAAQTSATLCPSGSSGGKRVLCGLSIRISQISQPDAFVACLGCGPGTWGRWSRVGETWAAKGAHPINPRASVLLVVTKPGYVGRYGLYRPAQVNTQHAGLKLYREGCIGSDIPADTILKSFHNLLRNLPTVPCTPPKGMSAWVATAGVNELSISTITHALVYGHISKPAWLTIAQTADSTCKLDPLAYSRAERSSRIWYQFRVKGNFAEGFQTNALLPLGRFCIYLQTGARYEGWPDGWTSLWQYNQYASGDVLTGPPSTALTAPGSTTVALTGNAPRTETLESYDLLKPCPEYAESAQMKSFGGSTMQVSGAFTENITTASFSQSGYVCSYLFYNGFTVAVSADQVSVAGTQFNDQSTYTETAAQAISPLSDPVGNTGTAGPAIAAGQSVSVRCVVNGMGLAPFDPVWYELASAPWGDAYYAPSFAFYNNGQTSGSNTNGPRWDFAVPFCETL